MQSVLSEAYYADGNREAHAMKLIRYSGAELRAIRKELRMTQSEFWTRFGVEQSASSRYENDRNLPEPVVVLLNIALAGDSAAARIVDELRAVRKAGAGVCPTVSSET